MKQTIFNEYQALVARKAELEQALPLLPQGYLSEKKIKGKPYFYLQSRVDGKIKSRYIKQDEVKATAVNIRLAKQYRAELPQIETRLLALKQAARLIDPAALRQLLLLKSAAGMDALSTAQKQESRAFANAMNAVEGVQASDSVQLALTRWETGEVRFLSVMQSTLAQYGFPVEPMEEYDA